MTDLDSNLSLRAIERPKRSTSPLVQRLRLAASALAILAMGLPVSAEIEPCLADGTCMEVQPKPLDDEVDGDSFTYNGQSASRFSPSRPTACLASNYIGCEGSCDTDGRGSSAAEVEAELMATFEVEIDADPERCYCETEGGGRVRPAISFERSARLDGACGDWADVDDRRPSSGCDGNREGSLPKTYDRRGEPVLELENSYFLYSQRTCPGADEPTNFLLSMITRSRAHKCPEGSRWNRFSRLCHYGISSKHEQPLSCPLNTKNPINLALRAKVHTVTDYLGAGPHPLMLSRVYRSDDAMPGGALGPRWRHSYEREVFQLETGQRDPDHNGFLAARAVREDGQHIRFHSIDDGVTWLSKSDVRARLTLLGTDSAPVRWALSFPDGSVERYDTDGRLVAITKRNGLAQTLDYDADGRLRTVTGRFGHQLTFGYDSAGRLVSVTDPADETIRYSYKNNDKPLAMVWYPEPDSVDGEVSREYLYEDEGWPYALTGIIDEAGERAATYGYDGQGRARSSERAGGAMRTSVLYNSEHTSTVTDATGVESRIHMETAHRVKRPSSSSAPCDVCGGGASSYDYTDDGYLRSRTDFEGRITTFEYVPGTRGQVAHRIEGTGDEARTVSYKYLDPYRDLVTEETHPSVAGADKHYVRSTQYLEFDSPTHVTEEGFTPDGEPISRTVTMDYYDDGNLAGLLRETNGPLDTIDADGNTRPDDIVTYEYYDCTTGAHCGQLSKVRNALGHETVFAAYDAHGRPERIIDPNGAVLEMTYHPRGWVTHIALRASEGADARVSEQRWHPTGRLHQATTPSGETLTWMWDAAGRLSSVSDELGNRVAYDYDPTRRESTQNTTDSSGALRRKMVEVKDVFGHLARLDAGVGEWLSTWVWSNDSVGRVTGETDPNEYALLDPDGVGVEVTSHETTWTYDAVFGRLEDVTERDGDGGSRRTAFGYDVAHRLEKATDPVSVATDYVYDDLGNQLETLSVDAGTTTYGYDDAGNVRTRRDARGNEAMYRYDSLERLTRIEYPDQVLRYRYDEGAYGLGRLTSVSDASGETLYRYDPFGNLLREVRITEGVSTAIGYRYDEVDRIRSIVYPSGIEVSYERDGAGQIDAIRASLDGTVRTLLESVRYESFGPAMSFTRGNALTETRSYDTQYRLRTLQSGLVLDLTYGYDANGNVKTIDDATARDHDQTFEYDHYDRLTDATATSGYMARAYRYDGNGNRKARRVDHGVEQEYLYLAGSNRLTNGPTGELYLYDEAGNVRAVGTDTQYEYDARGRLVVVTKAGIDVGIYRYDAFGRRVAKDTLDGRTLFVYDQGDRLIAEVDESGAVFREYVYLGEMLVAVLEPETAVGSLAVSPMVLGWASVGRPYREALYARGGAAPYSWTVVDPTALPEGLALSGSGVLSGMPTVVGGWHQFTVEVRDADDAVVTRTFQLNVVESAASGLFAQDVQAFEAGDGAPGEPEALEMLGAPDGITRDLDGGGLTLRIPVAIRTFSAGPGVTASSFAPPESFDLGVEVPREADLALIGKSVPGGEDEVPDRLDTLYYGYGDGVDGDGDGIADVLTGIGTRLPGSVMQLEASWSAPGERASVQFYDLDDNFDGFKAGFYLAIDDTSTPGVAGQRGDLDVDGLVLFINAHRDDVDGDGVVDAQDNCVLTTNPDQRDSNDDGYGSLCDGDLTNDGKVNGFDLNRFVQVFRTDDADADLSGDGTVNLFDLNIFSGLYRGKPGPSGVEVQGTTPGAQATDYVLYQVHTDHLGTPKVMTNDTGEPVWRADHEPFGRALFDVELVEMNVRFSGQYFDEESGLHYNFHRFYDPRIGRYLRPDPLGLSDGMNVFAYVKSNPVNSVDPSGLIGLVLPDGFKKLTPREQRETLAFEKILQSAIDRVRAKLVASKIFCTQEDKDAHLALFDNATATVDVRYRTTVAFFDSGHIRFGRNDFNPNREIGGRRLPERIFFGTRLRNLVAHEFRHLTDFNENLSSSRENLRRGIVGDENVRPLLSEQDADRFANDLLGFRPPKECVCF